MKRAWVTDDEAALLKASLSTGDEAARHWARFTTLHPFEDIWDSGRYALLPACHVALRGVDGIPEAPRLAGIHRRTWVTTQNALADAAAASSHLRSAGIDHCVHGALAVALTFYDDMASRPVDAPDLLVAVADIGPAVDALEALGWVALSAPDEDRVLIDDGVTLARVDQRLRLSWETCRGVASGTRDRATVPDAIERAVDVDTPHGPVAVTADVDLAAYLLTGGIGAGADHRLRTLADTARFVRRPTAPAAIARRIAELQLTTPARHVLATIRSVTGVDTSRHLEALAALPVSAADRRRHELLLRSVAPDQTIHPLLGVLARSTVGFGAAESARATPGVLTSLWGLDSPAGLLTEIPRRAALKAVRSLRSSRADP
ncbi:MAG: nucleotidyltransferase family protein [Acidimicrobiales bacterium]